MCMLTASAIDSLGDLARVLQDPSLRWMQTFHSRKLEPSRMNTASHSMESCDWMIFLCIRLCVGQDFLNDTYNIVEHVYHQEVMDGEYKRHQPNKPA